MKKVSILIFLVVFVASISAFLLKCDTYDVILKGGLKDIIPEWPVGTRIYPLPLGSNELVEIKIGEVLNYDDYYFVELHEGENRIQLFILYWRPDSIDERLVTGHTPDSCWVSNGWTNTDRLSQHTVEFSGVEALKFWEFGTYQLRDNTTDVIFTHLVSGGYSDYPVQINKPVSTWLPIAIRKGFCAKPEQLFIRVSWTSGSLNPADSVSLKVLLESIERNYWKFKPKSIL